MNRTKLLTIALLAALLLVACQPATVIVRPGAHVPEQRGAAPIYITATPQARDWAYEQARHQAGISRFIDHVDGQTIVCYYSPTIARLECLVLCGEED